MNNVQLLRQRRSFLERLSAVAVVQAAEAYLAAFGTVVTVRMYTRGRSFR